MIVREMKWHENELTNHRISWMVTFHSLLVAALAFAWDKPHSKGLIVGFGTAGVLVSISCWYSLILGGRGTANLMVWWSKYGPKHKSAPRLFAYDAKENAGVPFWLLLPWNFWPLFTIVAWLLLIWWRVTQVPDALSALPCTK
jgi:hypothetical protein